MTDINTASGADPTVSPALAMERIAPFFDADWYLATYADIAAAGVDPLQHFCEWGWSEGRNPRADFVLADYVANAPDFDGQGNPMLHAVAQGLAGDPTPTDGRIGVLLADGSIARVFPADPAQVAALEPAMDATFYFGQYPDAAASGLGAAEHYLMVGADQGHDPASYFITRYYQQHNADVVAAGINPFLHYLSHGRAELWRPTAGRESIDVLTRFDQGPLADAVAEATAIEPMIALPDEHRRVTTLYNGDPAIRIAVETLRRHFAGRHYTHVITIPHVRMSGAARVAGVYAQAMARLRPDERLLIVQTDGPQFEHPEWFPADVERFDLSQVLTDVLVPDHRIQILRDLLLGVGAERITNVNSRLMWDLMAMYPRQMGQEFSVWTYLFTWEVSVTGARVGYPIQWLRETVSHLDAVICDTEMLANDVRARFGFAPGDPRVTTLHTPVPPAASGFAAPQQASGRILWAGRLDRQKRPDVLAAIAQANPDLTFEVYGKAVLDRSPEEALRALPNVTLMGEYSDQDAMLARGYDAFLYTAAWDGMPTIVLDMIRAGLPVIAPAVGGLPEVIGPDTGWLIDDPEDVAGFSAALRQVLANPQAARHRVAAAQTLVGTLFSQSRFDLDLGAFMDKLPRRKGGAT